VRIQRAFREGWQKVSSNARMIFILYLCNLLFALVAVYPFHKWLKNAAGQSLLTDQGSGVFDLTFIGDLLRNYQGFSAIASQATMLALAYLVLSAFLIGGVVHIFIHGAQKFSYGEFISGGMRLFWRFLRFALYFLLIHIALLGICFAVLMTIGIDPMQMDSDVTFFHQLKTCGAVYLILMLIVAMTHDYVKIHLALNSEFSAAKAFRNALGFVRKNFIAAFGLYLLNLGILIGLFVLYSIINDALPAGTHQGVMLGFIFSQFLLIGRIVVKLLILGSASALVEEKRN
jgi:hypothetical protein